MEKQYTYRLAKSTKEDFMKKVEFDFMLQKFLNPNSVLPGEEELEKQFEIFRDYKNQKDTFVVFAEKDGKIVGYILIETYYMFGNGTVDYSYGNINDIYLLPREDSDVAFTLLHKAIDILLDKGINKAIMNVQTHNENRFLHYGICDEVLSTETYTRKDGSISCTKTLAINDLEKLKKKSKHDIMRASARHLRNFKEHGIELE